MKKRDELPIKNGLALLLLIITLTLFLSAGASAEEQAASGQGNDLTSMSIDELMNIEVASSATLTETKPRLVPAAITTITAEQIKASGARSLFEVLDIFVPNLQLIHHHWESDHLGLRGIINDRDDKYLLLVNGRIMNERTHFGALTERDLVLLRDIHHIDIVRGPGSALYGPGAISMVINIVTYTAGTFQGTEVTGQTGAIYEFYSAEMKHGQKFKDDDGGIFLYTGIGKTVGADQQASPQIFSSDFPTYSYNNAYSFFNLGPDGTKAGEPLTGITIPHDGADNRDLPALKFHAQVTKGNWDIWGRYTRGGKQFTWNMDATGTPFRHFPWGWGDWGTFKPDVNGVIKGWEFNTYGYQQYTGFIGHTLELTKDIDIDTSFSYDRLYYMQYRYENLDEFYREDKYYTKALLKWQPNDQHKFAFGGEWLHGEYGFPGTGYPDGNASNSVLNPTKFPNLSHMPRWSTDMYSILGEWQWNINDKWTTFAGARLDDHTFTDTMFSPRAALVFSPTEIDTLKLMWSRSVRSNFEDVMKAQDINNGAISKPEILDSAEFRYEKQQTKNLDLAASVFLHYNLEIISWDNATARSASLGTQKEWGIELEASYHTDKTRLTVSHAYTKLIDLDLEPNRVTFISGKPYGFGDDIANWSNHISKLTVQHKLDDKWTLNGSLRIYWGFPGLKDYNKYVSSLYDPTRPTPDFPYLKPGYNGAFEGSYFLDLGLQYKASKDLLIGVTGYNLLGIFDKNFNKRNFLGPADFRDEAVAVGVSVEYKF